MLGGGARGGVASGLDGVILFSLKSNFARLFVFHVVLLQYFCSIFTVFLMIFCFCF